MAFIQYSEREREREGKGEGEGALAQTMRPQMWWRNRHIHTLLTCCHTIIRDHSVAQAGAGYAVEEEGNWYVYCCVHSTPLSPTPY